MWSWWTRPNIVIITARHVKAWHLTAATFEQGQSQKPPEFENFVRSSVITVLSLKATRLTFVEKTICWRTGWLFALFQHCLDLMLHVEMIHQPQIVEQSIGFVSLKFAAISFPVSHSTTVVVSVNISGLRLCFPTTFGGPQNLATLLGFSFTSAKSFELFCLFLSLSVLL